MGRLEGMGGASTVDLLLKPSDSADRWGGGTMALFTGIFEVGRLGSAGTGLSGERSMTLADCRGGSDGLMGSARLRVSHWYATRSVGVKSPGVEALICGGNSRLATKLLFEVIAALVALLGSSCFFGGRGGNFAGSYAGART